MTGVAPERLLRALLHTAVDECAFDREAMAELRADGLIADEPRNEHRPGYTYVTPAGYELLLELRRDGTIDKLEVKA